MSTYAPLCAAPRPRRLAGGRLAAGVGGPVAVVVAFLLSACATTRERPVTDILVPPSYGVLESASTSRESLKHASALVAGATQGAPNATPWWHQFNDPRLNGLVERVLQVNTDLASAGLRLKQSRLVAGLATDALLPHADASVSTGYSKALQSGAIGARSSGATATVSYELDLWSRLRNQREAALWESQATAEDLQATQLALVGDTCNLYWTLAFVNQRIVAGELSIARVERTLALVRSQFNAGAVSRLEVRESEQNLEAQRAAQSQLVQQRVETRNALTVLLDGQPWSEADELRTLNDSRSPEIEPGIPAELLARRPDLRAAELRLRSSLTNAHATAASYYPGISLTGSVGGASTALGDVLADPVGSLGAGLVLPFLRWNEMRLNSEIASTDYEIAATDFRKTLYSALTDVNNALSARGELAKQLDSSQKSFDAAVDVERLYEVRYRSGATPLRLWLDAQETRRSAELALAQVRLSQLQNDATLFQALGGST